MRVLFTTQPADGHAFPMLSLSAALRAAGHDVLWVTSASYAPRLRSLGEQVAEAGIDWLESAGPVEPSDDPDDPEQWETMFARLFMRGVLDQMAADLPAIIADQGTDVIVRESTEWGASVAARRCEVPLATFDFAFTFDTEALARNPHHAVEFERMRSLAGVDDEDDDWHRGDLVVTTLPDSYRGEGSAPKGPYVVIRPSAIDSTGNEPAPDWVEDLDEAVYVTLGTVFTAFFPELFNQVARGAAAIGRDTVITWGASADPATLDLPVADGRVRAHEYVPQDAVLQRSAVAVTHGGTGTTLGSLARGVPMVVIPMGADQFAHARSVTSIGAGLQLDYEKTTADDVTRALQTVLADPSYAEAARTMGQQLRDLPGPELAVRALEDLAGA